MAFGGYYSTGTISATGTAVTGTGTLWAVAQIEQGDLLEVAGAVYSVDSVTDDTHIVLALPIVGSDLTDENYRLHKTSWLRYDPAITQQKVRQALTVIDDALPFLSVAGDEPDPGIGEDGQYAIKTNVGAWQQWLKVAGEWVLQSTPVGANYKGAWSAVTDYVINDVVTRNGSAYIAKSLNTNKAPESNPTEWDVLASKGDTGATGTSVRYGSGAPSSGTGNNGDFYINTAASTLYGPKTAGAWGSGISLVGPTGATGTAGKTVLNGSGAPANGTGADGDFYLDTTNKYFYGPKSAGAWPAGFSVVGPQGVIGLTGNTGSAGIDGNTVLYGSDTPSNSLGVNGDFYIATDTKTVYGPKAGGAWPAGTSLVGPQGVQGSTGSGLAYDASGTLAQRDLYDGQTTGYAYLQTDIAPFRLWVKASNTTADWAGPTYVGGAAAVGDLGSVADSILETFDYGVAA